MDYQVIDQDGKLKAELNAQAVTALLNVRPKPLPGKWVGFHATVGDTVAFEVASDYFASAGEAGVTLVFHEGDRIVDVRPFRATARDTDAPNVLSFTGVRRLVERLPQPA